MERSIVHMYAHPSVLRRPSHFTPVTTACIDAINADLEPHELFIEARTFRRGGSEGSFSIINLLCGKGFTLSFVCLPLQPQFANSSKK